MNSTKNRNLSRIRKFFLTLQGYSDNFNDLPVQKQFLQSKTILPEVFKHEAK